MSRRPAILVTGASRGLGAAVARWLASAGAAVGLVARSADGLEETAAAVRLLGGKALVLPGDVADPETWRRSVDGVKARFGRLDGLVNDAGVIEPLARVEKSDPGLWRRNLEVNLLGPYGLTRAALPALRARSGRVVNVSSGAAHLVIEGASAYCAAKAGLTHFTRVLAQEEPGLVVTAFRPGVVDTDMQAALRRAGGEEMLERQADYYRGLRESGELEPPEVPARSAAWLVLYAPRSLTGSFVEYDDPKVAGPARERFGEVLSG